MSAVNLVPDHMVFIGVIYCYIVRLSLFLRLHFQTALIPGEWSSEVGKERLWKWLLIEALEPHFLLCTH